uniref:Protein kinase domain-containing protein n=1 Tax=Ditylenchus dipsaci TaxID=166011 RepID=A0A915DUG3_9BILA
MSKEALNEAKYSQASDIYSFGVTLWEMYTYGRQPYEGISNAQVIENDQRRSAIELPAYCPTIIYAVMIECCMSIPNVDPHSLNFTTDSKNGELAVFTQADLVEEVQLFKERAGNLVTDYNEPSFSDARIHGSVRQQSATVWISQIAKLTMLSNGNSIVHSTPIDSRTQQQKAKNVWMVKRPMTVSRKTASKEPKVGRVAAMGRIH